MYNIILHPKYKIFPFYKIHLENRLRRRIKAESFFKVFQSELNKLNVAVMTS